MVRLSDAPNFLVGQLAVSAVRHAAELAGVDEKNLAAAIAVFAVFLVTSKEPETRGNLCRVKELAGEGDHAIDEVGFDNVLSDFAFAGLV